MVDALELVAMAGCALILVVRAVFWLKRLKGWKKPSGNTVINFSLIRKFEISALVLPILINPFHSIFNTNFIHAFEMFLRAFLKAEF